MVAFLYFLIPWSTDTKFRPCTCASVILTTCWIFSDDQVLQTKFMNDRGVVNVTGQLLICSIGSILIHSLRLPPASSQRCRTNSQASSSLAHPTHRMCPWFPPYTRPMCTSVQLCSFGPCHHLHRWREYSWRSPKESFIQIWRTLTWLALYHTMFSWRRSPSRSYFK